MDKGQSICEFSKNNQESIQFRLGEFRGHKFLDMRVFVTELAENGGKPKASTPTKKGLAVSSALWPQFKAALAQVETAMIQEGWLDHEDLAGG